MASKEFQMCSFHSEKEVQLRRKMEYEACFQHGSTLVAAMLAEGDFIDKALEPLKLDHLGKIEYVAKNSVFVRAVDGHEAIQIVWVADKAICIHRLLSKEFRSEFQALWLGVWMEPIDGKTKELLVDTFRQRVEFRELMRKESGVNSEIQFAASSAVAIPQYELRH